MASSAQFLVWPEGLGGVGRHNSKTALYKTNPGWIDTKKPPGMTSQTNELGFASAMRKVYTFEYLIWSPNLVWLTMALCMHTFMPYDLDSAREGWALDWPLRRLGLNLGVSFAYYGFFFAGLYLWGWSERKFAPGSYPTVGNMLHNFWYWGLGIAQWTCWECVVMRLWATGKVPFVTNAEVLASSELLAWNLMWVLLTPIWR